MHRSPSPLIRAVVGSTVVALLFALSFLGALHAPRPNDLPVGLAGPPAAVAAVAAQLDRQAPGAFDVSRYPDGTAARAAVVHEEVDGAVVLGPTGATLLVAGASGMVTRNALVETFSAAAAATGQQLEVRDVRPLPSGDRAGISSFLFVVTVLVPSMLGAVVVALAGVRTSAAGRAGAAVVAAVGIGLLNGWVAGGLYGALSGSYLQVAGVAALLSAAVSLPALALHRVFGHAGLALAGLLFVVFGMPATGGAIGPSFIPDLFAASGPLLPGGAAIDAVRTVVHFDGASAAGPLWVLTCWAAAGGLVLLTPTRRRPVRAVRPAEPAATAA